MVETVVHYLCIIAIIAVLSGFAFMIWSENRAIDMEDGKLHEMPVTKKSWEL